MNALKRRNHGLHRILAALLCLMLLFQHAGVYAEEPGMTATAPAITEPAEEIAETPAGADDVPEENAGTPAEILPEGNGMEGAGNAGEAVPEAGTVRADPADAPAADVEPAEEEAKEAGEAGEGPEGNYPAPAGDPGTPDTEDASPEEQAAAAEPTPIIDTSESITMFMPGFSLQPAYFEGTLVHKGPDYTVTVSVGPEAKIPTGVTMRAEEILPGTEMYAYYRGIMHKTLEKDEEMGEFVRLFDISFNQLTDGEETGIEPQANIEVEIAFREAIPETEGTSIQAVLIEENLPEKLKISTKLMNSAEQDDKSVDTVSFSSDRFPVCGIFQQVKNAPRVISARGKNYTIDVTFTPDAGIPEDAELIATEIGSENPIYENCRVQAASALNTEEVRFAGLFDIGIYENEEKITPKAPVNVAISLEEGISCSGQLYVVHFPDEANSVLNPEKEPDEKAIAGLRMAKTMTAEKSANAVPTVRMTGTEVIAAAVDGNTVTFSASGFSVYALVYTVDFHYEAEDGTDYPETVFSIRGGGSILLSDLLEMLHIAARTNYEDVKAILEAIDDVRFSDEHLVQVERDESGNDWVLTSLAPFTSEEKLVILLNDGNLIRIPVTDAQSIVGSGTGRIQVSKVMEYPDGVSPVTNGRISFALVKDGEYVYDQWGNLYVQSMNIQGNGLHPSTVTFEGLPDGEYEVWEMHGDQNSGYGRAYDGMLMGNNGQAQIDKIRVIANSNGQQNANGLYNNNATIQNGSTASMTFRNTFRTPADTTNFEVNKVWMDRKENIVPAPDNASVILTLYQQVGGQITSTGRTITLDGTADNTGEANSWQAVFTDLPKRDGNGHQITYMVKETTGWPDFYACKDKGKNLMGDEYLRVSGGTIYNRKVLTTIAIQKHFDIQPNKYSVADWQEMLDKKQLLLELKREDSGEIWYYTLGIDNFIQDNTTFELRIPNMSYGTYTLTEYRYRGLITDRRWDTGITTVTRVTTPGTNLDDPLNELRVQNLYREGHDEPEGANVYVLKVWDDLDDLDGIRPESVQVTLLANGTAYAANGIENPLTLSEGNDWNTGTSWYNLPTEDSAGRPIDYTVQEINVPDGYTSTMAVSGTGMGKAYTITNTHRPEGIGTISLVKHVIAPAGVNTPEKYYFTVKDANGMYWSSTGTSGPDYYTAVPIEINAETPVSFQVPEGQYTVSEIRDGIEIPGYSVTVTGEGQYTVHANETTTAEITNIYTGQDQPGTLSVLKNWEGNFADDEKTATVKLMRIAIPGGDPATIRITGKSAWSNFNVYRTISQYTDGTPIHIGDRVRVSATLQAHQHEAISAALSTGESFANSGTSGITFTYDGNDQSQNWTYHYTFVVPDAITNLEMGHYQNENWTAVCLEGSGSGTQQSGIAEPEEADRIVLDSENNWYHSWVNLPTGYTYYVEEVDPAEYVTVTYSYNGGEVPEEGVTQGALVVTNRKETGQISITKNVKVDGEDSAELIGQSIPIGLFPGETEPEGTAVPEQTAELEITGASTTGVLFENLPLGTYYVYELDAENHPVKDGGKITVNGKEYTAEAGNPQAVLETAGETKDVDITNSRELGSVIVSKTFNGIEEGQIPEEFRITAAWGEETRELTISGELTGSIIRSGAFPTYTWEITALEPDTEVMFTETEYTLDGYNVATTPAADTATGAVQTMATAAVIPGEARFTNEYTKLVDVRIIKHKEGTEIPIAGVGFKLERTDDSSWATQTDTTDGNGSLLFTELPDGTYRITETAPPPGYMPLASPITFTIEGGLVIEESSNESTLVSFEPASEGTPATFTVDNKPGVALPSTGGGGTLPYFLTGTVLTALAGIILLDRKRKGQK